MQKFKIAIPAALQELGRIFTKNGFSVYLVGGAVRDQLMGRPANDYDVATNARPEEIQRLFKRTIPIGIEHGTVAILFKGHQIEATTFRADQGYSDGRHPDTVAFADTIGEDLSRRDFTMNAIAVELVSGQIIDPYDGRRDIQEKTIRTVGAPEQRFSEDGLRPLRGIRFASQLNFTIHPDTMAAIPSALPVTQKVSIERFRDEFCKILCSPRPSTGLKLMEETGILACFIPELQSCRNIEQRGMHAFDVLDHLFYTCDGTRPDSLIVRTAALFHDIGKPAVRQLSENGMYTFYQHEHVSAEMTAQILRRLKFPTVQINDISALVVMHMFHYEPVWTDAAVRRFLAKITAFTRSASGTAAAWTINGFLDDLFELRRGDTFGITGSAAAVPAFLEEFRERIARILENDAAISLKDLAVTGKDLIAAGIQPGKKMGYILQELLDTVLDSPEMNTKEALLTVAQRLSGRITLEKNS